VHIVVVNCNTSQAMTDAIGSAARALARPDTTIDAVSPTWGVQSAEGFYDSFLSAASVLDLLRGWTGPMDAVVLAGFGEHGREGARQLLDVPVVDITEAAAMFACLVGYVFGVVTTTRPAVQQIRQSLLVTGVLDRCVGVSATGLGVLELETDWDRTVQEFVTHGRALIEQGAEALVLGCAGMAGLQERVQSQLGIPVIDGVGAAVSLCENLVHHGLTTSKVGAFAPINEAKVRVRRPAVRASATDARGVQR
jgi:allantoin racemase